VKRNCEVFPADAEMEHVPKIDAAIERILVPSLLLTPGIKSNPEQDKRTININSLVAEIKVHCMQLYIIPYRTGS